MYILNGLASIFRFAYDGIRALFSPYEQAGEAEDAAPLLHQQSLTSTFKDFETSAGAVRLCVLHTFTYYILVVLCFSYLLEKWPVVDSLYFATVLFTTIGYGDLSPTTDAGRAMTMILAIYGITIVGVFLGIYGGSLVEAQNEAIEQRQGQIKRDIVETMDATPLESHVEEDAAEEERETDPTLAEDVLQIVILEFPIILVVATLALLLGHFEGWSIIESLYWCVITGTTVGFGDDSPKVPGVRLACVFFLPLAVAVMGEFLGYVAGIYLERKQRKAERMFLKHTLTLADIQTMDSDQDGQVNQTEFLAYMLVTLHRVGQDDVDSLLALFKKLDTDHSGTLSREDLRVHAGRCLRHQS